MEQQPHRQFDLVYLALLDYMKAEWNTYDRPDAAVNLTGIRIGITELGLTLVYSRSGGLMFGQSMKQLWGDPRPAIAWPEIKKAFLANKMRLITSPDIKTRQIAKVVYTNWREADLRWQVILKYMKGTLDEYIGFSSQSAVDVMIDRIPEIEVEVEYHMQSGLRFRTMGIRDFTLEWTTVKEKLDADNVRLTLLVSPSPLSRLIGQAYEPYDRD